MRHSLYLFIVLGAINLGSSFAMGSAQICGTEAQVCLEYGAKVFQDRCSLCHGSKGMGEGILPLSLKSYPSTNLLAMKFAKDEASLRKIITYGGSLENIGREMPPWGDELTVTQLDSVVKFVSLLKKDPQAARSLLDDQSKHQKPSLKIGRALYKGRCVLCHGDYGQGDGKMARIIKNPPPYNLTKSVMPDSYLKSIILKGGEKLARSSRMPPWEDALTESEVDSVVLYIKTLRIVNGK